MRCSNHAMGCHWIGSLASRPSHQEACLVGHVARLQARVAELEEGMLEREKKITELMTEVEKEAKLNLAYATENDALREQAELDRGIIESLRLSLQHAPRPSDSGALPAYMAKAQESMSPFVPVLDQQLDNLGLESQIGEEMHRPDICPESEVADTSQDPNLAWLQAAENGDTAHMTEMLEDESFAAVNVRCSVTKETALHKAASSGHSSIVQLLLESPRFELANALDFEDNTALHAACLAGSTDVVRVLLASTNFKAVCLQNSRGRTALHCAAEHGNQQVAEMLLFSERFVDDAVNIVAEDDLLVGIADPPFAVEIREDGFTALHVAAKYGHHAVTEALLSAPRFGEVNAVTYQLAYTALHLAAIYGHVAVVAALLPDGGRQRFKAINVLDVGGCSALHAAAHFGKADVAKFLLESSLFEKADQQSDSGKDTALHCAAFGKGNAETARALLVATRFPTAAVNALNRHGGTALHTAAYSGNVGVAEVLLKSWRFAASNSLSKMGSTALHVAAFYGQAEVAQLLLASGRFTASNLPTSSGMTALHVAAMKGHSQVVQTILASYRYERSAVNAITTDDGSTALHVAVQFRHLPVVNV